MEAAADLGIPEVISLGALDMVNFGPVDTIPERYSSRTLHIHTPAVPLKRATPNWPSLDTESP